MLAVVGSLRLGGAEARVARVAAAIRSYGVDMEVCALEREGPQLDVLEQSGVVVHGTPYQTRIHRSDTATLVRTVNAIRRIVRAGRFDIVHTQLYWADVLGITAARLAGCPRVIVSRQALHGWTHSSSYGFHLLEQITNAFANELVADSVTVLRDAERHERVLPSIRIVIRSGVDVDRYELASPRLEGPLRMIHVGALAPRKGQEYALEAMDMLRRSGIETTLVLVGSGPDEAMLRERVVALGLASAVEFAGARPDPRSFLRAADLFVFPSRQEGAGIALLEAMASGLPVVASNVGGIPEALIDPDGGRLVPPQDPGALANAIADLANDRSRLVAMGRFNRTRIAQTFSLDVTVRQLAHWYLNGPPKGEV